MEKIYNANTNQMKAGIAILILEKQTLRPALQRKDTFYWFLKIFYFEIFKHIQKQRLI